MKTIDFHTHILPKADHGSDSVETSLRQIELSKKASVDILVATPHFYPHIHRVEQFLEKRASAYKKLSEKTDANILFGAEVLLCEALNKLNGLNELTIGNTKSILIELPFTPIKNEYEACVENLIDDGYSVILAHADRYPKESIERFLPYGVNLQLNASSISKLFAKKHLFKWIDDGLVVALGSDIHMIDKKAYSDFLSAKKKLGNSFNEIMKKTNEIIL